MHVCEKKMYFTFYDIKLLQDFMSCKCFVKKSYIYTFMTTATGFHVFAEHIYVNNP